MALKEILNNPELKDDAELTIGDKTYRAGDLRSELNAPPEGYVPREEYDRTRSGYEQLATSVQALLATAAKNADADTGAVSRQPSDPKQMLRDALGSLLGEETYNYDADKYVGPAMKLAQERAREEALAKFKEQFEPTKAELEQKVTGLTKRLALDAGRLWYRQALKANEIPENPQTKKPYSLQEIATMAFQTKALDNDGWPDYDRVLDNITAPQRHQSELERAREEGRREGIRLAREQARNNLIGLPGGRAARIGEAKPAIDTSGKSANQLFAEALGLAVTDPEVMGQVEEG